jgi:hypothetical protein
MEGTMNCLRKKREREAEAADLTTLEEKEELEELTILLEGRYGVEDCNC